MIQFFWISVEYIKAMKIIKSSLITVYLCAFYWVSCPWIIADSNTKASELYVQASLQMKEARTEADNYARIFELYQDAQQKIDLILSDYTDTDVAVRLSAGEIGIWGDSLERFKGLGEDLSRLALAEQNFLACSLFIAEEIRDEPSRFFDRLKKKPGKASALVEIARGYLELNQKGTAVRIVNQAYDTAVGILNTSEKHNILVSIASILGEADSLHGRGIITFLSEAVEKSADPNDAVDLLMKIAEIHRKAERGEKVVQVLSKAQTIARLIDDDASKYFALLKIADGFEKNGASENFRRVTIQIEKTVLDIKNVLLRSIILCRMAVGYASGGECDKAMEKVKNMPLSYLKVLAEQEIQELCPEFKTEKSDVQKVLGHDGVFLPYIDSEFEQYFWSVLAWTYSTLGQFERSFAALSKLEDGNAQDMLLAGTLDEYVKADFLNEAEEIIPRISDREIRAEKSGDIAVDWAKKGQFEQALETADTIRFPYPKVQALLEIAVSLAQVGRTEEAGIVFSKAVSKIGFIGREGNKAEALAEIAAGYRRAGIVPGDGEVALLKDLVQSRKPIDSFWRHWDWDRHRSAD
jgi:tetratricopeptide (TPR) repeat protein